MNNSLALNDVIKLVFTDGVPRNKDEQEESDLINALFNSIKDNKEAQCNMIALIASYHAKLYRLKTSLDLLCDTCADCEKFNSLDIKNI